MDLNKTMKGHLMTGYTEPHNNLIRVMIAVYAFNTFYINGNQITSSEILILWSFLILSIIDIYGIITGFLLIAFLFISFVLITIGFFIDGLTFWQNLGKDFLYTLLISVLIYALYFSLNVGIASLIERFKKKP